MVAGKHIGKDRARSVKERDGDVSGSKLRGNPLNRNTLLLGRPFTERNRVVLFTARRIGGQTPRTQTEQSNDHEGKATIAWRSRTGRGARRCGPDPATLSSWRDPGWIWRCLVSRLLRPRRVKRGRRQQGNGFFRWDELQSAFTPGYSRAKVIIRGESLRWPT